MTTELKKLTERSIKCYQGMVVRRDAPTVEEYNLEISELTPKFNGCYATNNSTVCYVAENEVYVTPYTGKVIETLNAEHFKKEYFYVPFSNGDYPMNEISVWKKILLSADQETKIQFEEDCENLCKKDISVLPEEVMKETLLIPLEGFMVERMGIQDRITPITRYGVVDCTTAEFLGNYAANNGVVTFVTPRGKQYIGKGYGLIKILIEYGYSEKYFFVPMSNWEKFIDPDIQKTWEGLNKF